MDSHAVASQILAAMREEAAAESDSWSLPPFAVFRQQDNAPFLALLDDTHPDDLFTAAVWLRDTFASHDQRGTVQILAENAPAVVEAVEQAGFVEQRRNTLLACTAAALVAAPLPPGVTISTLDAQADLAAVQENLNTNFQGFAPDSPPVTAEDADNFRQGLVTNRAFTAYCDGVPAAAGMSTPLYSGVTELIGITTLPQFRRRGIAAALTMQAAQTAFALGATLAYLRANNPEAERIYRRLGFAAVGTIVTYGLP